MEQCRETDYLSTVRAAALTLQAAWTRGGVIHQGPLL